MRSTPTLESLHQQWIEAFNSHDLTAHVALYTEDAMLWGSIPELSVGRAAIRSYFARRGPKVHVSDYPYPHVVMLREDVAVTAADADFADGDTLLPHRLSWTVINQDGNWLIAQHHGSPRGNPSQAVNAPE